MFCTMKSAYLQYGIMVSSSLVLISNFVMLYLKVMAWHRICFCWFAAKIDDSERLRPEELNQQNIEALVAENNLVPIMFFFFFYHLTHTSHSNIVILDML